MVEILNEYRNQEEIKSLEENLEMTKKIKESIETLVRKQGYLMFETEKTKYYKLSKFMISVYEDNYKFIIDVINLNSFKLDKKFGEYNQEMLTQYRKVLIEIYNLLN